MKSRLLWASMLLVPVACLMLKGADSGGIKGTVTDSEGAVISGAHVFIHWDATGSGVGLKDNVGSRQDVTGSTNRLGEFAIELPPGFYDVMISANAFSPQCRKVRIRVHEFAVDNVKLKADPSVTKELGDTVSRQ